MHKAIRCSLIAVAASLSLSLSSAAQASTSVFISVSTPPPELPVYEQPLCPGPGYVWTPGYWAWSGTDYYWVDGAWAFAPVGMLWTPGYWGWNNAAYIWHAGYWGPHVGFYGGINYGHGYVGNGYRGGYWHGRTFFYNDTVNHVDVTRVHNVYHKTVINHVTVNRTSYNGGRGGTSARPRARDGAYAREHHVGMTHDQREHEASIRAQHAPAGAPERGEGHEAGRNNTHTHSYTDPRAADQRRNRGAEHPRSPQQDRPEPHADRRGPTQQAHRAPPAGAPPHQGNAEQPTSRPSGNAQHRPEQADRQRGPDTAH